VTNRATPKAIFFQTESDLTKEGEGRPVLSDSPFAVLHKRSAGVVMKR
jgi:hypothetical protein